MFSLIDPSLLSMKGERDYVECSNRGTCDYTTGTCTCYNGFKSSDGYGNSGTIGDCGYQYEQDIHYNYKNTQVFTNCPFDDKVGVCSGHGNCDENTGTCVCSDGYGKL